MATVRAFDVLSNRLSEVHITGGEFVEITVVGLQSAPTLSSAVSVTQEKCENLVLDFVYIMLIFKPYIVVLLSVKKRKINSATTYVPIST